MKYKNSRVLFRLDDYAANRNFVGWESVLKVFDKYNIKVCIGVIPNNKDKKLLQYEGESSSAFWEGVSELHSNGHEIALHGYTHEYHVIKKNESIIPVNNQSEFVGLDYPTQFRKLSKSLELFKGMNLSPEIFMAPSHSYDQVTLRCLSDLGIKYITDGYYISAVNIDNLNFIPQQFGSLYRPILPVQTICIHPNTIHDTLIKELSDYCINYKNNIFNYSEFKDLNYRPYNFLDRVIKSLFYLRF
tara:strand:+ start:18740 stop:19474 length:735 start_codon:yes stop_codon:yes gene_type:complete